MKAIGSKKWKWNEKKDKEEKKKKIGDRIIEKGFIYDIKILVRYYIHICKLLIIVYLLCTRGGKEVMGKKMALINRFFFFGFFGHVYIYICMWYIINSIKKFFGGGAFVKRGNTNGTIPKRCTA